MLARAQAAGYAEADPSGDVEGHDAVNKLVILARLAFGVVARPDAIATTAHADAPGHGRPGITGVTAADLAAAATRGSRDQAPREPPAAPTGRARSRRASLPTAVASTPSADAGVRNRVEIDAEPARAGRPSGAGRRGRATANAVLGRPRARSPAATAAPGPSLPEPAGRRRPRRRVR